jgi:apolipoprotein N-acyltransferase
MVRVLDVLMAVVFAASAVLQYNDPDPWPWILIYAAAAVVCALTAARRSRGQLAPVLVGLAAVLWAAWILARLPGGVDWPHLAESMKASNPRIEESREALGLLVVSGWMLFIAGRRRREAGRPAR